jgi:proline iminopeptidase
MFHRCAVLFATLCAVFPPARASDPQSTSLSTPPSTLGEHNEVLNGVRLYYRVAGKPIGRTGRTTTPVVFLHGGPGYNSYSFATLAGPGLEQQLQMVYLDQRGCGRSERPWTQAYSIETLVEDIEALRHRLGAASIALIGHSFGGALALEYAVRHPEHVARMVLVGGFSDGPASVRVWRDRLESSDPAALSRTSSPATVQQNSSADSDRVCSEAKANMALVNQANGKNGKAFFDHLQFVDQKIREKQDAVDAASGLKNTGELSSALFSGGLACYRFTQHSRVTMPVLVIGGRHDGAIGIRPLRDLASKLPHATFLEYEHSAHFPYLEEPDRFSVDVVRFLSQVEPAERK